MCHSSSPIPNDRQQLDALLSRIKWDAAFGTGTVALGYHERMLGADPAEAGGDPGEKTTNVVAWHTLTIGEMQASEVASRVRAGRVIWPPR